MVYKLRVRQLNKIISIIFNGIHVERHGVIAPGSCHEYVSMTGLILNAAAFIPIP